MDSKFAGPQTAASKAYFDTLAAVPAAAFAKFLYNRDISAFNPKAPPSTEYQRHQKTINFGSVTAFVELALRRGWFAEAATIMGVLELNVVRAEDAAATTMQLPLLKTRVYDAYIEFCGERNIRRTAVDKAFWRKVRALVPGFNETRSHRENGRKRVITFPSLEETREQFLSAIHESDWDWEEEGGE